MRRSSSAIVLALLLAACRSAAPVAVPDGWRAVVGEPAPFVALYRMRCCGRSDLLATFRSGDGALSLAVAAMPGGVVVESWSAAGSSFLHKTGEECRTALPIGALTVGGGVSVPLDPGLAALVLSGRLPGGTEPDPRAPGWVKATLSGWWLRARLDDGPPRCRELRAGRVGERDAALVIAMGRHRGATPGRLLLSAGEEEIELVLVERRVAAVPAEPAWLAWPMCQEGS